MEHGVYRLLGSVYNVPHLVTEEALRPIVDYLQSRNENGISPQFAIVAEAKTSDDMQAEKLGSIGEIKIDGVLTYKPVVGMCGPVGVSYEGILEQADYLIDEGVDTIILTLSSPGGQAAHCFTTANDLRAMCDDAGVRLISYIDQQACSAALGIAVVADEVYIHPDAYAGSIGAVVALMDNSKALANAGLKPVYISSTPGKTGLNADGSFSQELLDDIQANITRLGNLFANHVSQYTGIPVDDILAMDAQVYHAQAAVEQGLANAVMDHKQFAAYMAASKGAGGA